MRRHRIWILLALLLTVFRAPWALPLLPQGGVIAGPALGMRVADLTFAELARLGMDYGVRVLEVAPQGPAHAAGLRRGDILTGFDGKPVYSVSRLAWLLRATPPGASVTVEYRRGGETKEVAVRLFPESWPPTGPPQPGPSAGTFLGVQPQEMTEDLREAFGAPLGQGVLAARVIEDSPAERAGLRAGDVIVRMDRKRIGRIADLHRVLGFFDPGERIQIELIRDATPKILEVTLGERPDDMGEPMWTAGWNDPQALLRLLPPPEYWRQVIDEFLESLQRDWRDTNEYPLSGPQESY